MYDANTNVHNYGVVAIEIALLDNFINICYQVNSHQS